ncbi:MAG: hypothetical protein ACREEM_20930 [Blastocatellia bacterium]
MSVGRPIKTLCGVIVGVALTTIGAHHHRSHRDDGYKLPAGVRLLTDWLRDAGYFTANLRQLPSAFGFNGAGAAGGRGLVGAFDAARAQC